MYSPGPTDVQLPFQRSWVNVNLSVASRSITPAMVSLVWQSGRELLRR